MSPLWCALMVAVAISSAALWGYTVGVTKPTRTELGLRVFITQCLLVLAWGLSTGFLVGEFLNG